VDKILHIIPNFCLALEISFCTSLQDLFLISLNCRDQFSCPP
jgi:hypothetical protein